MPSPLLSAYFNRLDKAIYSRFEKVSAAMSESMKNITENAIADAPIDTGDLKKSIKFEPINPLLFNLRADVPYAAYVEFGTGRYAKETLGTKTRFWKEVAYPFRGKTPGRMPAQPFFYPNVRREIPKLVKRIGKILSQNA